MLLPTLIPIHPLQADLAEAGVTIEELQKETVEHISKKHKVSGEATEVSMSGKS
jgi:hypothetical protein